MQHGYLIDGGTHEATQTTSDREELDRRAGGTGEDCSRGEEKESAKERRKAISEGQGIDAVREFGFGAYGRSKWRAEQVWYMKV